MVRSEIISKLSDKIHRKLKKSELEKILNIVVNTIIDGVKENKSVELRNFGRFSIKKIKEKRNARNPSTGEKIHIEERKSISFKMSKELKEKIAINPRTGDRFKSPQKKSISFKMSMELKKRINEDRIKN